jgi:hypothetical protein
MIPLVRLEEHLKNLPKDKIEVILEIRNIVASLCPHATERLDPGGIVYYDASRGGSVKGGICMISYDNEQLRLDFAHGAFLPDPAHLLSGSNLAKWGMQLEGFDSVPWDEVTALITASEKFDPASLMVKGVDGLTPYEKHLNNRQGH